MTRMSGEHTRLACCFWRLAETILFNKGKRREQRFRQNKNLCFVVLQAFVESA